MASTNFDLTNAVLITGTEPRRLENDATQENVRRSTNLLFPDLRFPCRSTLALQRLNPSLERCAHGTCLADEFFQPFVVPRCCCIVRVVERPRVKICYSRDIVVELPDAILNGRDLFEV